MCGIVGILSATPFEVPRGLLGAIAHRGPDGEGEALLEHAWLGHRRLAIIDLSDAGAQPMGRAEAGTIAFNGEIYDHAEHRERLESSGVEFRTHSDTEVLLVGLAREGARFLRRLHGMYALAWVPPGARSLVLARDHVGMKPLYYWSDPRRVVFASEVRALGLFLRHLGQDVSLDASSLGGFLAWGSVPEPHTVLKGVRCVPTDTMLTFTLGAAGTLEQREEVTRTLEGGRRPIEADRVCEEAHRVLSAAIRRHIVSDRPVALFLSGGLDSGVIAAELASIESARPSALTVALDTPETREEPEIVGRLSRRLGLPLRTIVATDWQRMISRALDAYDQPSIDGVNTYAISGFAKESGIRVALSGVGADEVFGGYAHMWRHVPFEGRIPQRVASILARLGQNHGFGTSFRRALLVSTLTANGDSLAVAWRRLLSASEVSRLMPGTTAVQLRVPSDDPLLVERKTYLLNTLLRDTDVMGMAHGVEIRAPYLDPEVLKLADSIGSSRLLVRSKKPKWVLREGWGDAIDPASLRRQKTGFSLDMASWLQGQGRETLRASLASLRQRSCMDSQAVETVSTRASLALEKGHRGAWVPLFALIQLEKQFERWGDAE